MSTLTCKVRTAVIRLYLTGDYQVEESDAVEVSDSPRDPGAVELDGAVAFYFADYTERVPGEEGEFSNESPTYWRPTVTIASAGEHGKAFPEDVPRFAELRADQHARLVRLTLGETEASGLRLYFPCGPEDRVQMAATGTRSTSEEGQDQSLGAQGGNEMADQEKTGQHCWVHSRSTSYVLVRLYVEVEEGEVVDTEEFDTELETLPEPSSVELSGAIGFYFHTTHTAVIDFGDGRGPQQYRQDDVGHSFFVAGSSIASTKDMLKRYEWDREDIEEAIELGGPDVKLLVRVPMSAATGKPSRNWIYLPCDEGDTVLAEPVLQIEKPVVADAAGGTEVAAEGQVVDELAVLARGGGLGGAVN